MTRRGLIVLILLFTGGLLAAAWWLHGRWMPTEAVWRELVASAPAAQRADALRRAADAGPAGMPAVVEALCSPDDELARTATWVILDELDRWERHKPETHQAAVARLATELVGASEDLSPAARERAARIARRILCWPLQGSQASRLEVVDHCRAILGGEGPEQPAGESTPPGEPLPPLVAVPIDFRPEFVRPMPLAPMPLGPETSAAVGQTIVAQVRFRSQTSGGTAAANRPQSLQSAPSSDTPPLPATIRPTTYAASLAADAQSLSPNVAQPPSAVQNSPHGRGRPCYETSYGIGSQPLATADAPAIALPEEVSPGVSNDELIRLALLGGASQAAQARGDLAARGFDARRLNLLNRLRNTNASLRCDLAQQLPAMLGTEATTWLLVLADDTSGDVRLAALSLLATSGDPQLRRQVLDRAATDPDLRVRRLVEQLQPQVRR